MYYFISNISKTVLTPAVKPAPTKIKIKTKVKILSNENHLLGVHFKYIIPGIRKAIITQQNPPNKLIYVITSEYTILTLVDSNSNNIVNTIFLISDISFVL